MQSSIVNFCKKLYVRQNRGAVGFIEWLDPSDALTIHKIDADLADKKLKEEQEALGARIDHEK